MRACWICRSTQPASARFCSQCGVPLGHLATVGVPPAAPAPASPPLRYHSTRVGLRLAYALTGHGSEPLVILDS